MKSNFITGYIEGFYGKLLNWSDRKLIVESLYKNRMNTYLYAPKEDKYHRLYWRQKYSFKWRNNFKDFTSYSKKRKISVIAGIAPGLDYNYDFNVVKKKNDQDSDFSLLLRKAKQLLADGASNIALLMDDIPNNFNEKFGKNVSEGKCHAVLANKLSQHLKKTIYFVPRIYSDELIPDSPSYLKDLKPNLDKNIKIFTCGRFIVNKDTKVQSKINTLFEKNYIFWDNFYANDYCPRRLIIGPYKGRKNIKNYMINPTGMIKTDLLILDIVTNTIDKKNPMKDWFQTLIKHNVPISFKDVSYFFMKPDCGSNPTLKPFFITKKNKYFEALEKLLWTWKGDLSREWYPFLFGLKHDLQIHQEKLCLERLIKTQNLPLAHTLKNLIKGENL